MCMCMYLYFNNIMGIGNISKMFLEHIYNLYEVLECMSEDS